MRSLVSLAVLFACSEAIAQPCEVTIPRAPDAVKAEIELWVRAEPRCTTSLEVRVVPTEGGYYLFARDPEGRVRERVVPDAQSAGVLVASWVADDSSEPTACPLDARAPGGGCYPVPIAAVPVVPVVPVPMIVAPGDTPAIVRQHAPAPRRSRWLTFGALAQVHGPGALGLRGELDVLAYRGWSLGAAVTGTGTSEPLFTLEGTGFLETHDYRFNVTLARTATFGRWDLRVAGGVGAMHTKGLATITMPFSSGFPDGFVGAEIDGWFFNLEASALLSRRLGSSWALAAGPVATYVDQRFEVVTLDSSSGWNYMPITRNSIDVMAFCALRHEL